MGIVTVSVVGFEWHRHDDGGDDGGGVWFGVDMPFDGKCMSVDYLVRWYVRFYTLILTHMQTFTHTNIPNHIHPINRLIFSLSRFRMPQQYNGEP